MATTSPPTYNLIDANNVKILGKFYEPELAQVDVLKTEEEQWVLTAMSLQLTWFRTRRWKFLMRTLWHHFGINYPNRSNNKEIGKWRWLHYLFHQISITSTLENLLLTQIKGPRPMSREISQGKTEKFELYLRQLGKSSHRNCSHCKFETIRLQIRQSHPKTNVDIWEERRIVIPRHWNS